MKKQIGLLMLLLFLCFCVSCESGSDTSIDGDTQNSEREVESDSADVSEADEEEFATDQDSTEISEDGDIAEEDLDVVDTSESDEVGEVESSDDQEENEEIEQGEIPEYKDCVAEYGPGWAFNPSALSGDGCKDCTSKICPEDGSVGVYHITTKFGRCVCETAEGYFFSDTTFLPMPCDKDGDGWTTVTAKEFIENDDEALRDNARCNLRQITQVVLVPEDESLPPVAVTVDPMPLYEMNIRDDQDLLVTDDTRAPAYGGSSGRLLRAGELNSLTKACVAANADYNGNGVADIAEWPGVSGVAESMQVYLPFAYFIETHHSWYDEASSRYFIRENSRTTSVDGTMVPVVFDEDGSDYWRQCSRRVDSSYDPEKPAIGMDFAGFMGMLHHSQFKCLQVVSYVDIDPLQPQKITVDQLADKFVFNDCKAEMETEPADGDAEQELESDLETSRILGGDDDADGSDEEETVIQVPPIDPLSPNPSYPKIICQVKSDAVVGDIGFAAVKYVNYDSVSEYARGCVNECVEGWADIVNCSGYPDSASCDADVSAFGMGRCGCAGNFVYPECLVCLNHYDIGTNCEQCLSHWNPDTDCTTCAGHFSQFSNCTTCLGNWTGAECNTCATNWDINTNCTECLNHFDERGNCTYCVDNSSEGHWTGASCSACKGNYSLGSNCKNCLDDDTNGHWSGSSCTACKANFYSGTLQSANMVKNPSGENNHAGWTAENGSTINSRSEVSGNFMQILSATPLNPASAYQLVDLSSQLAKLTSGAYSGIKIEISGSAWVSNPQHRATMRYEIKDKAMRNLAYNQVFTTSTTAESLGTMTVTDTNVLTKMRYLKVYLMGEATGVGIVDVSFRNISVVVKHAPSTVSACFTCEDGWSDSNSTDGVSDCLKCASGSADTEHWDNSSSSACNKCWNDSTHGHWDYPNCDTCSLFWVWPGCTSCPTDRFALNTSGECSKTVNIVQNGGAESTDMSMWNSNIPVSRHTSHNDINSAAEGQYFFSFNDAGGEKEPYAVQRITISDTYKSLIQSGNIGWVYFSAKMAEYRDSDTPHMSVYLVTTPGTNGTKCGGTISTSSKTWALVSSNCQLTSSLTNITEIRVLLEVDNDDGGSANGYFDAINVHFSAKEGE